MHTQERLLALSRRARRALERELSASNQQRSQGSVLNRSASAQPSASASLGQPHRPQEGSLGRALEGIEEGSRPGRAVRGRDGAQQARQKDLSDRAIRILEELSSLGRQVRHILSVLFALNFLCS